MSRWLPLLMFLVLLPFAAKGAEPFPLWDNHESVAEYAQKVHLPPTKTLELGGGVKMELVLIPAGKFVGGLLFRNLLFVLFPYSIHEGFFAFDPNSPTLAFNQNCWHDQYISQQHKSNIP